MSQRRYPQIDFLGKFPLAVIFSLLTMAGSIYLFISLGESKYGVDFTGGHEFLVRPGAPTNSDSVRSALAENGYENAVVQAFEKGSNQYLIRLGGNQGDSITLKEKISGVIKAKFSDASEILRQDFVGPTVGSELRKKAVIAVVVALIGMLIFISIRFELAFAMGAVVALFHDVIVSTGIYLLSGQTFSMGALAAALTVVGYSVNDTIVIFDRIREELHKSSRYNLVELMNRCINMMLSRTLITHLVTFFATASLYFFGGGAIADLSLYLLAGIIAGSYSTIYIACPVVLLWHKFRGGTVEA